MSNPPPEKLSKLIQAVQSRWKRPERRLVDCGELAVLRGLWIASRDELLALDNAVSEVGKQMVEIEERLPAGRDIMFWVNDPTANVPFSMFAEALGVTSESLAKELVAGISRPVLDLVSNRQPLCCPLCSRKR